MACLRDNFAGDVVLDGRYVTISPLNHGSFGMVFMARDLQTNDTVAIKCLTKKVAAQDIGFAFAVDDKSEELVLHSHLGSHPNIVNLIRSFETEAHIYLVLEFCQRGDLYEAIRNGQGPLETEHVRRFMLELVDAVSYIHSKGVYHRDIKPENIFLTDSGAMKLGDFGLATTEKWSLETTVGSDRYMAPEQYDSAGAGYSPAEADIWAIGICLLNVLFSRNPFTTPTEADPLFLDFSRDKQSLFDVFPSMSQDTYEVIVHCMNLDPKKRSLVGARAAICRVVSFTTLDEALDDFCSAEQRRTIATANREPLRTPSIQSPLVDQGSFPWARALHNSPRPPMRTLSAIPDNESYTEELFTRSEESADWFSGSAETPSMASVLGSNLATSMQSLSISRPIKVPQRQATKTSPMAGSLPINMAKPSALSSMSLVFGGHRKEMVSKSWSDMWEEDIEEEESIRNRENLKALNARTWSHESKTNELLDSNDNTIMVAEDVGSKPLAGPAEPVDMDADLVADGFFFHEPSPLKQKAIPISTHASVPYSPPTKKSGVDKWTALGERRRAHTATVEVRRSPEVTRTQRPIGFGFGSLGAWEHYSYTQPKRSKDRGKDCPWNKGRDWNWRREKRADLGDVEWVGGWQESHAWPAHHL